MAPGQTAPGFTQATGLPTSPFGALTPTGAGALSTGVQGMPPVTGGPQGYRSYETGNIAPLVSSTDPAALLGSTQMSERASSRVSPLVPTMTPAEPPYGQSATVAKPEDSELLHSELDWNRHSEIPVHESQPVQEKGKFYKEQRDFNKGKPFRKEFNKFGDKKFKRDNYDKPYQKNIKAGQGSFKNDFRAKEEVVQEAPVATKEGESDHERILRLLKEAKGKDSAGDTLKPTIVREESAVQSNKSTKQGQKGRRPSRSRSRSQSKKKPKEDISSSSKKRIEMLNKRFDMLFHKKKEETEEEDNDDNRLDLSPRSPDEFEHEFSS